MADEFIYIACVPTTAMARPAPAVSQANCHTCQTMVWLAQATVDLLKTRAEARVICIPCMGLQVASQDPNDPIEIGTTAAMDEEVRRYTGLTVTEGMGALGITVRRVDKEN